MTRPELLELAHTGLTPDPHWVHPVPAWAKHLARGVIDLCKPAPVNRAKPYMSCPSRCGACGEYCGYTERTNFCPNCGAALDWSKP